MRGAKVLLKMAIAAVALPMIAAGPPASGEETPVVALVPAGVFALPVAMTARPGEDAYYVVEKVGLIHAVRAGVLDPVPVLDVRAEVSDGLEQGLLGAVFEPVEGDVLYVNLTNLAGDTEVREYAMDSNGRAVTESKRLLLLLDQPFDNHNAGHLAFGPDGYLYIPLGDGGSANDPFGNGQNLDTLFGKMLRIDPEPSATLPYTIPAGNPFVGVAGRDEIWAYGLRNPWKFSFDRATGDLWIADVGQGAWEEINVVRSSSTGGENYGWDQMEGLVTFQGGVEPANHTRPIHVYGHTGGKCSVTGGYVYRGSAIPSLQGWYVYADWCEGSLRALREEGGVVVQDVDLLVDVPLIVSFGEDAEGELYALSLAGPIFKLAGL